MLVTPCIFRLLNKSKKSWKVFKLSTPFDNFSISSPDSLALSASHSPSARKLLKKFKVFLFVKKSISQSNKALLKPKFDFSERFFSTRKSKSLI